MTRRTLRRWQRDDDMIRDVERNPKTPEQLSRLHPASRKKISMRMYRLFLAGLVRRVPYVPKGWIRGNVEFAYFTGRLPRDRTLEHTIMVSENEVLIVEWLRTMDGYTVEFYYPGQVTLSCSLLPDLVVLIRRADQQLGVWFVELDRATERINSTKGYSLAGKLAAYAQYYDEGKHEIDFTFAGKVRSCRVALIVPEARLDSVQRLIRDADHNFALLTSTERLRDGLHRPIWVDNDHECGVDFFGRGGDRIGDQDGERCPASEVSNP